MKKAGLLLAVFALALTVISTTGCDNRSQLEKDADNAAKKMENMMK